MTTNGDERWNRGTEAMDAVYGEGFSATYYPIPREKPYHRETVDHLFGDIWSRPGLSVRDRRLLVIGVTAALGRGDLIRIQALGALRNGELSPEELREGVLQLAFYTGWGNATSVDRGIEDAIADHEKERARE
ncbi:carboxymuconolactone decarboxylase family protein [Streptomyces sp. GbtcB6]|uniref:carboxymuconolactone decarboxylase family protein n=1 Tax=Streptomyces sp. GbtcB6 TaxID=2824751 RepID=UPI0020C61552|nr:carboxymuconolactone decarboxylase family protein [Streptomyces sp. GbtcB6]